MLQWLKARPLTPRTGALQAVGAGADINPDGVDVLLSLRDGSQSLREVVARHLPAQPHAKEALAAKVTHITFLSGPEGGLSALEEDAALDSGFKPTTLGPRVLRAETAALAALAALLI